LTHELRHRGDANAKQQSLDALAAVCDLLLGLGYSGTTLLFDEAESIVTLPNIRSRTGAYRVAWDLCCAQPPPHSLTVFTGTYNLEVQVKQDRQSLAWLGTDDPALGFLHRFQSPGWSRCELQGPTRRDLVDLVARIVKLHAWAFDWSPEGHAVDRLAAQTLKGVEANLPLRSCIQALVAVLDTEFAAGRALEPVDDGGGRQLRLVR
jgi:hypothetical protein